VHALPAVVNAIDPAVACAGTVTVEEVSESVQEPAACVTVKVLVATVMVAVRAEKEFGVAYSERFPLPLELTELDGVSHTGTFVRFQLHPEGKTTETFWRPPACAKFTEERVKTGSVHDPAAWLTVNTLLPGFCTPPFTEIFPVSVV
jgi:hypothetical protein